MKDGDKLLERFLAALGRAADAQSSYVECHVAATERALKVREREATAAESSVRDGIRVNGDMKQEHTIEKKA
jgi:hypothetical protein